MSEANASGWLVLRRDGGLWAVAAADLASELPRERPSRLRLRDGSTVTADELLGLAPTLAPRPLPRCARPFVPPAVRAVAVWRRQPLAVLGEGDAASPDPENPERPDHGDQSGDESD